MNFVFCMSCRKTAYRKVTAGTVNTIYKYFYPSSLFLLHVEKRLLLLYRLLPYIYCSYALSICSVAYAKKVGVREGVFAR